MKNEVATYGGKKSKCLPVSKDDLQEVCRMSSMCIRDYIKRGVAVYADSDQGLQALLERASEYFEYVQNTNGQDSDELKLIPTVEGLCGFLGVSRQSLFQYEKRSDKWHEAIAYIKNLIANTKMQLALRGKLPALVLFFDLGNNNGYQPANHARPEQQEYERKKMSTDDIQKLLASLPEAVVESTATEEPAAEVVGNGFGQFMS